MARKDTASTPPKRAHCWHVLRQLLCQPPVDVLKCCHCGGGATRRHAQEQGHGRHVMPPNVPGELVPDIDTVDAEECRP